MRYALLLILLDVCFAGQRQKLELSWPELEPAIAGRKITMVLPDGTHIGGHVLAVENDTLRLRVTQTSDGKVMRKGPASIPRTSVRRIRIERHSKHWRAILTPGVPALMMAAMATAANSVGHTPDPVKLVKVGVGVTAGSVVGGYYIGKRLDRQELTEITVR